MKSTGLFGKNSGRVGGVVYSNYRGIQVVRAYQPQVKNPNSQTQIAQRARFKLASQIAASLGGVLRLSFVPKANELTARNAWIKKIFPKIVYSSEGASLAIDDIMLTNAVGGITNAAISENNVRLFAPVGEWDADLVKARVVFIGYNNNDQMTVIKSADVSVSSTATDLYTFDIPIGAISPVFSQVRAIGFVYQYNSSVGVNYSDYVIDGAEATLEDLVSAVSARNILFSESFNIEVPRNV